MSHLLFLALALLSTPAPQGARDALLEEHLTALDERMPALLEKERVPGVALAWIRDLEVVAERFYGVADLKSRAPITATSAFGVASVSKMFTAWGVMKLVEDERIDLDARVQPLLERWKLPRSRYGEDEVTLRQLLSHTAGYDMSGEWHYPVDRPIPELIESLRGNVRSPLRPRLMHTPGSDFRYSGVNYALIQILVEDLTGETFFDYMREEVLHPLGLEHTDYEFTEDIAARVVTSHNPRNRSVVHHRAIAPAAGSIHTTLRDLETFALAWFAGPDGEPIGRGVIRPESLHLVSSPAPGTRGGYGLGYQIKTPLPMTTMIGSSGGTRGWTCEVRMIRESGDGLICLTNSTSGSDVLDHVLGEFLRWRERSLEAEWARPLQADTPFTHEFLGTWSGLIEGAGDGTVTYPFTLTMAPREDGTLGGSYRLDPWKRARELEVLELTPDRFLARGLGTPTALFVAGEVGSDEVSGHYYHDGKMTFRISRAE